MSLSSIFRSEDLGMFTWAPHRQKTPGMVLSRKNTWEFAQSFSYWRFNWNPTPPVPPLPPLPHLQPCHIWLLRDAISHNLLFSIRRIDLIPSYLWSVEVTSGKQFGQLLGTISLGCGVSTSEPFSLLIAIPAVCGSFNCTIYLNVSNRRRIGTNLFYSALHET